jgi:peptide/nickel transport system ATP-binding protein
MTDGAIDKDRAPGGLAVSGLRVNLTSGAPIVEDIDLYAAPREILGLVGESGSGKTTTALAMLGYTRPGVRITAGEVRIADQPIDLSDELSARSSRARLAAYVPQDPANSLNPAQRIRASILDTLRAHGAGGEAPESVESVLSSVHLPASEPFSRRYPHELSGGQQQRVTIGMALGGGRAAVLLDEPTTGLDVVTQKKIIEELARLRAAHSMAMVYVSHDLAVVAALADRIAVMYAGRVVEEGLTSQVLASPRHPYTVGLVASVPDHLRPRRLAAMPGVAAGVETRSRGCAFAPRCPQRVEHCERSVPPLEDIRPRHRVRCFEAARTPSLELEGLPALQERPRPGPKALLRVEHLVAGHGPRHAQPVVRDVSFTVAARECLAIIGESGSGKTTIARCVAGLHEPRSGEISFDGDALPAKARNRPRAALRRIQIVFQNPYESLNPRHSVADALARPMRLLLSASRRDADREVEALLELVRLPASVARRLPRELSGGERQRVAIARALAAKPDLLICDEITSALDVSVQAAVLSILEELRNELSLAMLFITHNLGVVATVADRVLVLENGEICETGSVAEIIQAPRAEYTRTLVGAAPRMDGAASTAGGLTP